MRKWPSLLLSSSSSTSVEEESVEKPELLDSCSVCVVVESESELEPSDGVAEGDNNLILHDAIGPVTISNSTNALSSSSTSSSSEMTVGVFETRGEGVGEGDFGAKLRRGEGLQLRRVLPSRCAARMRESSVSALV